MKDVDSRVFTRMLRKDGSVTISLRNFVGKGILKLLYKLYSDKTLQHFFNPWFSVFTGEDLNVKVYNVRWTDDRR